MIERGQVCMLPSRARLTAAEFGALRIIGKAPAATKEKLPDFFAVGLGNGDQARAVVDGKWCLLTVQFHFGARQVYAERITIVAAREAA